MGGGGTAVGGLIANVGSLIEDDGVMVLERHEYWVDVVTGEVTDAVFAVAWK